MNSLVPLGPLTLWVKILAIAWAVSSLLGLLLLVIPYGPLVSFLFAPISLAAYIVGAIWCYRVSANAHLMRPGMRWATGWAAGAWFIPVANIILPVLVMGEVARATAGGDGWRNAPLPSGFTAWAALWITYQVLGLIAGIVGGVGAFLEGLSGAAEPVGPFDAFVGPTTTFGSLVFWSTTVTAALWLAVLPFWLRLVRMLDETQTAWLQGAGGSGPLAGASSGGADPLTAPAFR